MLALLRAAARRHVHRGDARRVVTRSASSWSSPRAEAGADTSFTWIDEAFARTQGLLDDEDDDRFRCGRRACRVSTASTPARRAAGLVCRPLVETVRDTLRWDTERGAPWPMQAGPTDERERALLAGVAPGRTRRSRAGEDDRGARPPVLPGLRRRARRFDGLIRRYLRPGIGGAGRRRGTWRDVPERLRRGRLPHGRGRHRSRRSWRTRV